MITLQDIKDEYYMLLTINDDVKMGFEQYLRENYTPVYDGQLNFLGYEHGNV